MPSSVYNYVVAFGAAFGGLLFGYEIGVVGQVLVMDSTFGQYFGIAYSDPANTKDDGWSRYDNYSDVTGNVTMTFLLGCLAGAAIVSWMADFLGRKRSILVGGILFVIGVTMQVAAPSIAVLYTGRVIGGLGIGILSMAVPLFIAETAPTHLRGRMVTVQQLMITIGILIASIINAIIIKTSPETNLRWRLALGMQLIPGVGVVVCNVFMPYSPRWLANRNRDSEAIKILARLRGVSIEDATVQAEFREIKESIEMERQIGTGSWAELLKPGIRNRVVFAVMLQFFQQWTGINFILYYLPNLIVLMGFTHDQADIPFAIANNFVNMVGTFPGMYLVERSGRRALLLWGAISMAFFQLFTCLMVGLSQSHGSGFSWLAVFSIFGFTLSFASTWGPIVWVYQSEIFPLRVRAKGTGVGTMSNWANNAIIAKVSPKLTDAIDYKVYALFGGLALAGGIFVKFFIPETKNLALEELDTLFGAEPLVHETNKTSADVELVKEKA
ncbi:hypothetical protein HDU87_004311 [Geranomyces variabilis]|uniref:Major facilitator superfamily (MFS) profile domain-containing protein n=1 Tax=Geranomyces variabilis TaxID=109894 RepID=A0AAD5TP67_9FUNG|nr:hypothetical protein HDU87_004311 [Geranomyces variabilis]